MQTLLINKGDHEHNVEVLKNKSGELIIARRQTPFCAKEYGPCPLCLEWLKINVSTTRHQNTCVKRREEKLKKGDAQVRSSVILGLILPSASKRLLEEVYPIMTNDDLTSIAQSDPLIVGLGNYWLRENVGNKLKRKYYTSTKMRGAARLLKFLECNSKESQCSSMSDFMKPCKFDEVVSAGMQCGTIDADDEEELKHPSAVIKIKFDISRMANFKIGMAVRERNTEIQKDCTDFLFLLKTEWSNKVTKIATQLLRERRMQKGVLNVNPIDLQKIAEYLKKKLRDFQLKIGETDPTLYRDVAQYTLARLLTYNKRRSGELEQMLLKNYESRSTQIDDADHELMGDLTKTEKLLLGSQEIIKIQGKAGHVVPVLVPLDVSKALQYLTEKEVRVKAGVKQGNIYVFANTGNLVHRAYDALKRVCLEAEVACPDRITSVTLRKYFATMTQVLGMQDHQVQWMCKHLGHSFNVHKLHYRSMSEYIERINMGKMMLIQDFNAAPRFKGKNIEDIGVEDIIQEADKLSLSTTGIDCSVENTTANIAEKERLDTEQDSLISDQEDDQQPSQKKRKVVRQKWNVVEMEEIRRYFADNLQSGKCPGFKAIQKAMALSKSVDGLLHLRAWDNIKKKVWNMAKKSSLEHGKEI